VTVSFSRWDTRASPCTSSSTSPAMAWSSPIWRHCAPRVPDTGAIPRSTTHRAWKRRPARWACGCSHRRDRATASGAALRVVIKPGRPVARSLALLGMERVLPASVKDAGTVTRAQADPRRLPAPQSGLPGPPDLASPRPERRVRDLWLFDSMCARIPAAGRLTALRPGPRPMFHLPCGVLSYGSRAEIRR
jgi:hypothetical protein